MKIPQTILFSPFSDCFGFFELILWVLDAQVSHKALNGLKQMLAVRSAVVLPFVIPKLTTPPMTHFNAKALASLAEVTTPMPILQTVSFCPLPGLLQPRKPESHVVTFVNSSQGHFSFRVL